MKAQISYEFIVTILIFIGFFTYVMSQFLSFKVNSEINLNMENINLELFKISEILTKDTGYPSNWNENIASLKRLGLVLNGSLINILDMNKVNNLTIINPSRNYCYNITKYLDANITISLVIEKIYPTNQLLYNCTDINLRVFNLSIERVAVANDNSLLKIKIYGK